MSITAIRSDRAPATKVVLDRPIETLVPFIIVSFALVQGFGRPFVAFYLPPIFRSVIDETVSANRCIVIIKSIEEMSPVVLG